MKIDSNFSLKTSENGEVSVALQLALRRGISSFEKLLTDPENTAALWHACECGEMDRAKALIRDGADASLVLLRNAARYDRSKAASNGAALQNLISAGADVSIALAYAIAENHAMTESHEIESSQVAVVQTLLLLGADGATALNAAISSHDQRAITLLLHAGVPGEKILIEQAIHDDADTLKPFNAKPIDMTKVVMELARHGHEKAIGSLITSGVDVSSAMLQLLQADDSKAVTLLIAAGAPTEALMTSLSRRHGLIHRSGIALLSRLIAAGADPSAMLFEIGKAKQDLVRAEILILAGATVSSALRHASASELQQDVRKTLFLAWAKVSLIKTQVQTADNTPDADITVAEKILSAIGHVAQPEASSVTGAMKDAANALVLKGEYEIAELLLALESADWASIKQLSADVNIANKALLYATAFGNLSALRLLKAAGVPMAYAAENAMKKNDVDTLRLLIDAGWSRHHVLESVVAGGFIDVAKELIHKPDIDKLKVLRGISADFGNETLQRFIPSVTDGCNELLTACLEGDVHFAKTLIAAGVDASETLMLAVSASKPDGVTQLIALGANTSHAAAHALDKDYGRVAQLLFALGADPYLALEYATETGRTEAVAAFTTMEISLLSAPA